jgi:hypothetical protein
MGFLDFLFGRRRENPTTCHDDVDIQRAERETRERERRLRELQQDTHFTRLRPRDDPRRPD